MPSENVRVKLSFATFDSDVDILRHCVLTELRSLNRNRQRQLVLFQLGGKHHHLNPVGIKPDMLVLDWFVMWKADGGSFGQPQFLLHFWNFV